jgi:hypothetical protein
MNDNKLKSEQEEKQKTLENAALTGAAVEVVNRYGSANKEFLVGYSGVDNETGQVLSKSLKSIAESKVNPQYKDANIHQQAGFDAEVAKTSRDNAENIINKNGKRTVRTDDHPGYGKNHPVLDHVETRNGEVIPDSGSQMKFVNDPKSLLDKIARGKGNGQNDLSRYSGNKLDLPSDQVKEARKHCENQAQQLREEAECLQRKGKGDLATEKRQQARNYEELKENIRDSGISTKEAEFYRLHPKASTVRDIVKVSHRAGLEQEKSGAVIGGSISIIKNLVALVKGEKKVDEAAISVIKDTGSAAAVSYATGAVGSAVKGAMQNSGSSAVRTLSKTNLPAIIVTTTLELGKTLTKYIRGEIDGVECLVALGEKGTGMLASAMFATIGQIAIPIPVVGGLIGGMLGYALSSAGYGQLVVALQEAKLAHENRIRIEAECEEAVKMIRQYRAEMEAAISAYLSDHMYVFQTAFDDIKNALQLGDIDGFIAGANSITRKLGGKPQFENFMEFDAFMQGAEPLKL